jgi:hypothetical protein
MREGDEARRLVAFLGRDFGPDLAKRLGDRAVRIQGDMTGDVGAVAADAHPGEGHPETRRYLHRLG